jgi:hypothetical protein
MGKRRRIKLSDEDRSLLTKLITSGSCMARVQTRARILLLSDFGQGDHRTDRQIIASLGTSVCTIMRTRQSYCDCGLEAALYEKPRTGKPPKITGDVEARLTMIACSEPPEGHARWTVRLLAEKMVELEYIDAISAVAIHKHLKKTNSSRGASNPGASANRAADSSPRWKTS